MEYVDVILRERCYNMSRQSKLKDKRSDISRLNDMNAFFQRSKTMIKLDCHLLCSALQYCA